MSPDDTGDLDRTLDLTIAVVTHNRQALLMRLLDSLAAMDKPAAFSFEILIVLNACTDSSRAVAERYANTFPVRILDEPRVGVSPARNAAVDNARGAIIAWLDDDVIVDRSWLEASAAAFRANGDAAFFGGAIEPLFEGELAPWLEKTWPVFGSAFALRRPAADTWVDPYDLPYGANFAVRREWLRRYRFDEKLGRRKSFLLHGMEESCLIESILKDGGRGRWVSGARVQHIMPPRRQTRRYLFRYYAGYGYYLGKQDLRAGERLFDGGLLTETIADAKASFSLPAHEQPEQWAKAFMKMSIGAGRLMGRISYRTGFLERLGFKREK